MMPHQAQTPFKKQQGAALVMGMIVMVLLTVLSLTTLGVSALEERMAANARDRIRAFQAAEAALRFCEGQVTPLTLFKNNDGMYKPAQPPNKPRWETIDWGQSNAVVEYTGIPLVARQPRCIVEELPKSHWEPQYYYYRVTARGFGANERTVVMLQTTLKIKEE